MSALADYTRLQKLGMGSFATTHLVQHKTTGKQSVLKRIPCKHLKAANAALLEVKVLLSCNHMGITAYHDFFLDSDSDENIVICLLMEFCSGGDLWERIAAAQRQRAVLPAATSVGWLLQIIDALRYLHSCSILHRDIKPENIFITQDDAAVKLGDFGLAKGQGEQATTQCGTPDYMAPEVLEGRPYTIAADVFSLGAVLYALITSRFPKMLALHLGQGKNLEWPDPSTAKGPAQQLAASMLLIDASKRPDLDSLAARAATLPGADQLQGPSLAAREAALRPVPTAGGERSAAADEHASAGGASPAVPAATPAAAAPPSRPEKPSVSEVGDGVLVLRWKRAPDTERVLGWRVLLQAGGSDGFREVIADTGRLEPTVRLTGLRPSTWYEIKVCALNSTGTSPPSLPCSPVQTLGGRDSPREPQRSASEALLEESGLQGRYVQTKNDILLWESEFERGHGRPATEKEKAADAAYQELLHTYKKLKHAKRRNSNSSLLEADPHPAPRGNGGGGGGGGSGSVAAERVSAAAAAADGGGDDDDDEGAGRSGKDEEMTFSEEEMETAARLFEQYDTDADGVLSEAEFTSLMHALAKSSGRELSAGTVDDLFRRAQKVSGASRGGGGGGGGGVSGLDFGAFLQMQRKRRRMKSLFRSSLALLSELGNARDGSGTHPANGHGGGGYGGGVHGPGAIPARLAIDDCNGGGGACSSPSTKSPSPDVSPDMARAGSTRAAGGGRLTRPGAAACGASSPKASSNGAASVSPRSSGAGGARPSSAPLARPCASPKTTASGGSSGLTTPPGGGSGSDDASSRRREKSGRRGNASGAGAAPTSSAAVVAAATGGSPTARRKSRVALEPAGGAGAIAAPAASMHVNGGSDALSTPSTPPSIDRPRRAVPERIETKALNAEPAQPSPPDKKPASSNSPEDKKKKTGIFGRKEKEKPPIKPPDGFKVAVKSSHPSPRPFQASDLTFD